MAERRFDIVGVGVHTIDYVTTGILPTHDMNLSRTGPITTHPGGIGNGMPVAAKLLPGRVGAATWLGDDANGQEFLRCMEEAGVDTRGIGWSRDLPRLEYEIEGPDGNPMTVPREQLSTGMSFICLDPNTKNPLIFFSPGANQVIGRDNLPMDYLKSSRSAILSYATLLRSLDRDGGAPMAELVKDLNAAGVLTMLDTHSIPGADYTVLDKPLKEVDIMGCNIGEARGITGLGRDATPEQLLKAVGSKMNIDGSRSRLVAVSMREEGCAIAYYRPGEQDPMVALIPACKIKLVEGTGAGDTFKIGLMAYILEHEEEYRAGRMNPREAGRFGNTVAASYISAKGTEGVGTYAETLGKMAHHYLQTMEPEPPQTPGQLRREPPATGRF